MNAFDKKEARVLAANIVNAQAALTRYLKGHFPPGARCDVLLHAGQKNPTPATISGAYGDIYGGTVTVEIDSAKARSRQRFRRLSPESVLNVRPAANGAGDVKGGAA